MAIMRAAIHKPTRVAPSLLQRSLDESHHSSSLQEDRRAEGNDQPCAEQGTPPPSLDEAATQVR